MQSAVVAMVSEKLQPFVRGPIEPGPATGVFRVEESGLLQRFQSVIGPLSRLVELDGDFFRGEPRIWMFLHEPEDFHFRNFGVWATGHY